MLDKDFSAAFSVDGKLHAAIGDQWSYDGTVIVTFDPSTTRLTNIHPVLEGHILTPIWAHGKLVRFATVGSGCITIREIKFTLTQPYEVIESFPVLDGMPEKCSSLLFLPTLERVAISSEDQLLVWDAWGSKLLLKAPFDSRFGLMSFSSDDCFFGSTSSCTSRIHVWKEFPAAYTCQGHSTLSSQCVLRAPS